MENKILTKLEYWDDGDNFWKACGDEFEFAECAKLLIDKQTGKRNHKSVIFRATWKVFLPPPPPTFSNQEFGSTIKMESSEEEEEEKKFKPQKRRFRKKRKRSSRSSFKDENSLPNPFKEECDDDEDPIEDWIPPPPPQVDQVEPPSSSSSEEEEELGPRPLPSKRKHRKAWTRDLFPPEKTDEGEYFCADCNRGNNTTNCRKCGRQCWRWCDGEECESPGFFTIHHKCFSKKGRKNKSQWKREQFPNEYSRKYFCADCKNKNDVIKCRKCGRDCWRWCGEEECEGYFSRGNHDCFKKNKLHKRRNDFPQKKIKGGDYYCRDCERVNDVQRCRVCQRNCWRWCRGEECGSSGYRNHSHSCFKKSPYLKQKRKWRKEEFPKEKKAMCYCADCEEGNDIQACRECGRTCWKWCGKCNEYRIRNHHCGSRRKSTKRRRYDDNDETRKNIHPSKKKRKLE